MKIINVDRTQFQQLDSARRIISHDHARRFAIVDLDALGQFGISWQSDRLELIVILSQSLIWIGIDQKLVALRLDHGTIQLAMPLGYSLLQILHLDALTIAISELEVLVFNSDASLRLIKGLLDIAIEAFVEGDRLLIRCLDNTLIKLNVQTGDVMNRITF
ncbi:hypothetical protein [Phormidesmis priestleyi]